MKNINENELSPQEQKIAQVNNIYIVYPRHQAILDRVEKCHRYSKFSAEPECMFIKGRIKRRKTGTLGKLSAGPSRSPGHLGYSKNIKRLEKNEWPLPP